LPEKRINIKNKWNLFLAENFPHIKVKKSHGVCYLHFERPASFKNYNEWSRLKSEGKKTR
jgi:hypothetical protein